MPRRTVLSDAFRARQLRSSAPGGVQRCCPHACSATAGQQRRSLARRTRRSSKRSLSGAACRRLHRTRWIRCSCVILLPSMLYASGARRIPKVRCAGPPGMGAGLAGGSCGGGGGSGTEGKEDATEAQGLGSGARCAGDRRLRAKSEPGAHGSCRSAADAATIVRSAELSVRNPAWSIGWAEDRVTKMLGRWIARDMLKLSAGGAQVNGDECERSSLTKWRTAFLTEGRVAKMAAGACVPLRRQLIGPVGNSCASRQPRAQTAPVARAGVVPLRIT